MEKLIDTIPTQIENPEILQEGVPQKIGLCIRFSVGNQLWVVAYGSRSTPGRPGVGSGFTLIEALDDFIKKQNKLKKNEKGTSLKVD